MKIVHKVGFFLMLMIFTSAYNYYIVNSYNNDRQSDGIVIDISGRQRMLSQRIAFHAEQISIGRMDLFSIQSKDIDLHQRTIEILKDGGDPKSVDRNSDILIPKASDDVLQILNNVNESWMTYKTNAERISFIVRENSGVSNLNQKSKNELEDALKYLRDNASKMLELNDSVTRKFVEEYAKGKAEFDQIIFINQIIRITLISVTFFIIYISILPIIKLSAAAKKIASTDKLTLQKFKPQGDYEVRTLIEAFNFMIDRVQNEYDNLNKELVRANHSLEEQVKARTLELDDAKKHLEQEVQDRTKELTARAKDLQKFNDVMVDREIKLVELKNKVLALEKENSLLKAKGI